MTLDRPPHRGRPGDSSGVTSAALEKAMTGLWPAVGLPLIGGVAFHRSAADRLGVRSLLAMCHTVDARMPAAMLHCRHEPVHRPYTYTERAPT